MGVNVGIKVGVLVGTGVGEGMAVEVERAVGVEAGLAGMMLGMLQVNAEIISRMIGSSSFFMGKTILGRGSGVKAGAHGSDRIGVVNRENLKISNLKIHY